MTVTSIINFEIFSREIRTHLCFPNTYTIIINAHIKQGRATPGALLHNQVGHSEAFFLKKLFYYMGKRKYPGYCHVLNPLFFFLLLLRPKITPLPASHNGGKRKRGRSSAQSGFFYYCLYIPLLFAQKRKCFRGMWEFFFVHPLHFFFRLRLIVSRLSLFLFLNCKDLLLQLLALPYLLPPYPKKVGGGEKF